MSSKKKLSIIGKGKSRHKMSERRERLKLPKQDAFIYNKESRKKAAYSDQ
jgi:hypothetical protein